MAKTKFFRVAVEGVTVDGRTIERKHIEEMAAGYAPDTYTARINCEHISGYSPEKPFNCYGKVVALKTEEVDLELGGKTVKKLALLAQLDVTDDAAKINKAGQKMHSSVEIHPSFSDTGKAYLVGMALTDTPASLGTEELKFTAMRGSNLVSPTYETEIEIEAVASTDAAVTGLFTAMAAAVARFTGGAPSVPVTPAPVTPPPAQVPANDNDARFAAVGAAMTEFSTGMQAALDKIEGVVTAIGTKVDGFSAKLDATEDTTGQRQPALDVSKFAKTDC